MLLQINFIFVVITLKVLWANRQTTKSEEIACNKDAVKYSYYTQGLFCFINFVVNIEIY